MNVVIAGYGVEGKESYKYWQALGHTVAIADERSEIADTPSDAEVILGADAFDRLDGFDSIIRSPGINPAKLAYGDKVWSATNEFFANCPAPIIGVTGTKGKGTTASMIASILRAAGKTVHLVGNIGEPALKVLPKIYPVDIVIYELSSFQLWDIKRSPHIAVILGIEPDHLDVHANFDEYLAAKANIRKYQGVDDACYYHSTNIFSHQIAVVGDQDHGPALRYATQESVYVQGGSFMENSNPICPIGVVQLPGTFNIENACAAISAARNYTIDNNAIERGLHEFTGLPHRLKFVAEKSGVKYYDDSIATTPGSAIAAMNSFTEPKVLILGGSDKGAEYQEVIDCAKSTDTTVLAIGQTGKRIYELCQSAGVAGEYSVGTMSEIVIRAAQLALPGSVVLLSPASASFDQYKSYSDRGDQFIAAVKGL